MGRENTRRWLIVTATATGCYAGSAAAPSAGGVSARTDDAGAAAADPRAVTGVPCDVAGVLITRCAACHGRPTSNGAPMSMVTYEDLTAASKSDASKSVIVLAIERMRDTTRPMPPTGASDGDIMVLTAWIAAGLPRGTCAAPLDEGGAAVETPTVCTSNSFWNTGGEPSAFMLPGAPCLGCHRGEDGPVLAAAGTVYPTAHEPDDCNGIGGGVTIVLTDGKGQTLTMQANEAGNFFATSAIATPYRARVIAGGRTRAMGTPQTSGDCNACHTEAGDSKAPGRVMAP